MKNKIRAYGFLTLIAGLVIALDQLTKALVIQNIEMGGIITPWEALPFVRIVHWYNTGVAFGMFQNGNTIFTILVSLVCLAIIYFFPRVPAKDWALRLALSLELGGAVGNLIDRLSIGHVTDFIAVGNFPVFNVADSAVTVGVCVLILGVWLQERREKAALVNAETTSPDETQKPAAISQSNE